jgi:hypothetical protein
MLMSNVLISMKKPQYGKTPPYQHEVCGIRSRALTRPTSIRHPAYRGYLASRGVLKREQGFVGRYKRAVLWKPSAHGRHEPLGVMVVIRDEHKVIDVSKQTLTRRQPQHPESRQRSDIVPIQVD